MVSKMQKEAYTERKEMTLAKHIRKSAEELEKLQRKERSMEHPAKKSKKSVSKKSKK